VPNLRQVQGRVRNVEGLPDTIADEGTACRLNRCRCTQVNLTDARQRAQKGDLWSVNDAGGCSSVKFSLN
jgi:hypothetical protein